MDASTLEERPFFGLKWKTLIVLSAVLALVNASLAYLVYQKSTSQFEAEQTNRRLTLVREFEAVFSKALESMSTVATLIPRLAVPRGIGEDAARPRYIAAALQEHGLMLDLEWGVEGVHYFDRRGGGGPVMSWPSGRLPPVMGDLLEIAGRDEAPQGRLVCDASCIQLIVLPLLHHGATDGFLVVERAIGDSLKEFHRLSGAQVVVLGPPGPDTGIAERRLAGWRLKVAGITHEDAVLPLVEAAAARLAIDEVRELPRQIRLASDWYEISALPAKSSEPGVTVLLIDRVTAQVEAIHAATQGSVLLGVGGLVVTELILLLLLWGPMQRIQRAVQVLPMLAEKRYAQLRDRLSEIACDGPARDEIDVMINVISDVSDQIEALDEAHLAAEAALRESEQGLQMAQSLARVASWTGRPLEGTFAIGQGAQRISPVLAHVSTWSEFLALVHPEDRCAVLKAWRAGCPGGSMDVEFRLEIGERLIDVHAMAEFEALGRARVLHATGMLQDVSEMRAVQRALEGHRDRLEEEVVRRTSELVAERNRAERLAQAKGRFLTNMSHEIRTPLNAVLGLSQVGMQQSHGRRIAATFEQILGAGDHLLNVVNDVLDLSKLEAGKLVIEPRAFELRKIIRHCTDMLRPRVEAKSLTMRVTVADDIPRELVGDDFRLRQILLNLLSNAVKFTEQGTVSLEVHRDGDRYIFKVRDTGVGIPPDQLGRLFTPFHQVADVLERHREGAGLGLSISNTLATMMGGALCATRELASGSEFVLQLPLETRALSQEQAAPKGRVGSSTARLNGIRVLVADDVAINRKIVEVLLEAEGAEVTTVDNGRAAVQAVLQGPGEAFDVVLMDVEMPEIDGRHATREIRLAGNAVPIIGVTAHVSAAERAISVASGMHDQLVKPIMQQTLVDTILEHAEKTRRGAIAAPRVH